MTLVELPYLFSDYDRHGNRRWFVRLPARAGETRRKIRIRATPGTQAFTDAYWVIRNAPPPAADVKPQLVRPGSVEWLVRLYWVSADFKRLDEKHTQSTRRRILMKLIDVIGDKPALITQQAIRESLRARGYGAAKDLLTTLRGLYRFATEAGHLDTDPTVGIRLSRRKTDGWHTWTPADCAQFEEKWPVGTKQHLAYALGLYTAQRGSDVIQLGRNMEKDGRLRFRQWKNRASSPVDVDIPIVPPLRAVLDATPTKGLQYLMTEYGVPYTADGLRTAFRIWCDEAGLQHCSFHGLRKAAATRLAEAGCTPHQIMAVLGHTTHQQAATYTARVDRAGLANAGMDRLYGEQIDPPRILRGSKPDKKS
jgi:integrase/recombinase XerD